ncbi:RNA polymerase sigma factor [Anatilimnocola sp. NA78]|uniref:RNA polymerase sigma factor n=1 Tax=Anatilimnocola sp. NA78 TaxID=3415683 RepID=UPI003CE470D9
MDTDTPPNHPPTGPPPEIDFERLRLIAVGVGRERTGCWDQADEIAQETLLRCLVLTDGNLHSIQNLPGYVFRVARNVSREHITARIRRNSRFAPYIEECPDKSAVPTDSSLLQADDINRIEQALTQLHPDDREIIELRIKLGLGNGIAAQRLGVKENTASMKFRRAIVRLRDSFNSTDTGDD